MAVNEHPIGGFRAYKKRGKNAVFKAWQEKLNRSEKLPRGKFFVGKKAGRPKVMTDEFWRVNSHVYVSSAKSGISELVNLSGDGGKSILGNINSSIILTNQQKTRLQGEL